MLKPKYRNTFKRDVRVAERRGKDIAQLKEIMRMLAEEKQLPIKYKDHPLKGNYNGRRECHVQSNWLLIYKIESEVIVFERTGTHSDLFRT